MTIDRLAQGGRGVARHDGFVLFVQRGFPGDRVNARVTRVRKSFADAEVAELLEAGPSRITPPCKYVGTCGGCAWQALDYPAQLQAKEDSVREVLERLADVENVKVDPILGATNIIGYRNKVEYTFAENEDGSVGLGFHVAGRWDQLVAVDACLIADPRGRRAHEIVVEWANKHGVEVYDKEGGYGFARNLIVRVGYETGEVLVHLVTSVGKLPRSAELVDDLVAEVPGLVGVLHSQAPANSEVALDKADTNILHGKDYFHEVLGGVRLKVRPGSFLQTNTEMAEQMYQLVRKVAQPRPDDVVYDLYCGIGSISLMLAKEVASVIGVEVVEEAIECAQDNAKSNGIENAEFQTGNVRPILRFSKGVWPDPTLVVVDPPRSGLVEKVIRRIADLRPERIVYVSCNPSTFATDVASFHTHGYQLTFVQPVDQFPHTHHVELVSRLEPIEGWVRPKEADSDE
ncbi:MAG: 23S rRNA (uracil(1939)-C(5))-methyltransferase RlmD [Thermoleophilia bacterium]|nr:23S rRNA (uracil(1939)-C(5))-methyltransferase RlmD [Thermoleophilia bacterium]